MLSNTRQALLRHLTTGVTTTAPEEEPPQQRSFASGAHRLPQMMRNIVAVRQLLASDTGIFQCVPEGLWR